MRKQEFLAQLRKGLSGLPQQDVEERLTFYSEMIDDRMEDGCSEEDAVREIGNMDALLAQIAAETAAPKKQRNPWKPAALLLSAPLWLPLLIAAAAVVLSLAISLWAVFASLVGCAVGCLAAGVVFVCSGHVLSGIATFGAGLVCTGLSVFLFFAGKGLMRLTKTLTGRLKNRFVKKEES